ncbi:MAG: hypothetical protein ACXVXP_00415 [Mycobacteriaceae bacterium]
MRILCLTCLLLTCLTATAQARPVHRPKHRVAVDREVPCQGVPVQTITVVNQAGARPDALTRVERAATDQSLQLRAAWATPCVRFGPGGWKLTLQRGTPVHNDDGSTTYSLEGQHCPGDVGCAAGAPYAMVYTGGLTYDAWARGFTHEVVEMLVDPTGSRYWRLGKLEVCDPVENLTYTLDGVAVSDFTLPTYFGGGPGPWDQMRQLTGSISLG